MSTDAAIERRSSSDSFEYKNFVVGEKASQVLFDQFEPYIISSNDGDVVSVYDWDNGVKIRSFRNGNPEQSRITSLQFINQDDIPLLAVGSSKRFKRSNILDEGCIRIYKKYQDSADLELVSSWRALNDLMPLSFKHPMNKLLNGSRTGLVCDWQQSAGCFFVSGGVKIIRVWDAEREMCVQDIPTKSIYTISSITSERGGGGSLLFAGCTDGSVRKYDRRIPDHDSMVHVFSDHRTPILKVSAKSNDELVTASSDGEIRIWDLRHSVPLTTYSVGNDVGNVAVHELASLVVRF